MAVVLLTTAGCRKKIDLKQTLSGKIQYQYLLQPVEGAEVELLTQPVGNDGFSVQPRLKERITLGANGYYYFELDREKIAEYVIRVSHPAIYFTEWRLSPDDVEKTKNFERNFMVPGKNTLKIKVRSKPGSTGTRIQFTKPRITGCECCDGKNKFYTSPVDSVVVCNSIAGTYYPLRWSTFENAGAEMQFADSIFATLADTTMYLLEFE